MLKQGPRQIVKNKKKAFENKHRTNVKVERLKNSRRNIQRKKSLLMKYWKEKMAAHKMLQAERRHMLETGKDFVWYI